MKKIIAILFAAINLVACKKDNDTQIIPVNNAPKYKTLEYKGEVTTYTYDGYGRQVKLVESDGSRTETSYSKDKVTQQQFNADGTPNRTITIWLNKQGLQSRMELSDKPGAYTEYKYNAQQQLTRTDSKNGADISWSELYYTGGNLDSTRYYQNGVWTLTNVYTYYLDKENVQIGANAGILFYGADKKNLMKSQTHVAPNGTITPEEYSYEFDALGRIITLNEVSQNGPSAVHYTYY